MNPQPEILLYTRLRKSPYFYASGRHGVVAYSVCNHQYHPRRYGDPFEEYWALVNDVTLWDVGAERQVEITGPDAFTFTNMLTLRDLNQCAVGQCMYALITTADGGILSDPILLRLEENRFWLSTAERTLLAWCLASAHWSGLDVQVSEADVGPVQIQGRYALEVMIDLFGESIRDLRRYRLTRHDLDSMSVVVSRTGFTNEPGYEIYLENARRDADRLWETVLEAGKPHGMRVTGPVHISRIETGILSYDADMSLDTNPYEVAGDYPWLAEVDQPASFIGQPALQKIRARGVDRKVVGVEISGEPLGAYIDGSMPDVFPVVGNGAWAGQVSSACYSPRLEKNIGYAMVPIESADIGTGFGIETPHGTETATVAKRPFLPFHG
ncbi:glycine cleavage T C-terminal barrel domain-containing protein [Arthrobacter castelli]|uniref:glycine cleavage T C-terminal barrel domain-containing protein n=1 Tax=Arthrobacter castelli TaxID=271431 RepID=UPI00041D2C0A|nr:glycine cleavage T C-terminal barrel domain-containing protein [Arthrobacter castelli]